MAVASLSVSAERSTVIDFVPYFSEFGGILIRELEADKLQVGVIRPVLYTLSTSIRTTRQHDRTTKNSMFPNTGYMLEFLSFFLHTHHSYPIPTSLLYVIYYLNVLIRCWLTRSSGPFGCASSSASH